MKGLGLEISAICAWGGHVDLGNPENLDAHIEEGKRLLEYAADLECGIWQGHCGIMPHSKDNPKWARFVDSFGRLCEHGEKVGAKLAIETGPEPPEVLLDMIEEVGSPSLAVNYAGSVGSVNGTSGSSRMNWRISSGTSRERRIPMMRKTMLAPREWPTSVNVARCSGVSRMIFSAKLIAN